MSALAAVAQTSANARQEVRTARSKKASITANGAKTAVRPQAGHGRTPLLPFHEAGAAVRSKLDARVVDAAHPGHRRLPGRAPVACASLRARAAARRVSGRDSRSTRTDRGRGRSTRARPRALRRGRSHVRRERQGAVSAGDTERSILPPGDRAGRRRAGPAAAHARGAALAPSGRVVVARTPGSHRRVARGPAHALREPPPERDPREGDRQRARGPPCLRARAAADRRSLTAYTQRPWWPAPHEWQSACQSGSWKTPLTRVRMPALTSRPESPRISKLAINLSVSQSKTVFTMNGTKRKSSPKVSSAGTNRSAWRNHPRKKLRTLKTTATRTAVVPLRMRTAGRNRESAKMVSARTTRC